MSPSFVVVSASYEGPAALPPLVIEQKPVAALTPEQLETIAGNERAVLVRLARLQHGEPLFAAGETPTIVQTGNGPVYVADGFDFVGVPKVQTGAPNEAYQFDLKESLNGNYFVFAVPDKHETGSKTFVTDQNGDVAVNAAPGRVGSGSVTCNCGCSGRARSFGSVAKMIGHDVNHGGGDWVLLKSTETPAQ